jgi:glycosyltransferase involved in cell wall biosynthesis
MIAVGDARPSPAPPARTDGGPDGRPPAALRIDHVVNVIVDAASGVAAAVRGLATAEAARHGNRVHVHALAPTFPVAGVTVHAYASSSLPLPVASCSWPLARGLRQAAGQAQILHVHNLWSFPLVHAAWAVGGTGCRLVCSPHGALDPRSRRTSGWKKWAWWHLLQRRALNRVDLFRATSVAEAEHIRTLGFRTPVVVVPNGVDVPALVRRPEAEPRTVGFLGRIHPVKALDRLIAAWRLVAPVRPDWHLRLCGPDGGALAALRVQAAGLPRVSFAPAVAEADKSSWYASCDLVVLPSHGENFGMVVAEALAHGVPVVCSTGAPWGGLVSVGCGWWVGNEVAQLQAALLDATNLDRGTLAGMGERGRAWMAREFSWDQAATRMLAAYDGLLAGTAAAGAGGTA